MAPTSSSRWCPTPEQLMILEELYRSGIRTPNASQIQRITSHLSLYGKIEGKNVFYWFQNHKARDRQKLRRKLIKQLQHQQQHHQQQIFHHHLDLDHDHDLHHQHHLHLFNQSTHYHHHQNLLNYFDLLPPPPPPPTLLASSFHPLSTAAVIPLHHQGGMEGAATQMMNGSTWNLEYPQNVQTEINETTTTRMYGYDLMMMMEKGPPPCSKRPLETLELFPITATNLKEELEDDNDNNNNNSI